MPDPTPTDPDSSVPDPGLELEWKAPPRGRKPDIIDVPATVAALKARPATPARIAKNLAPADANRLVRQMKAEDAKVFCSTTKAEDIRGTADGKHAPSDTRDVYAEYQASSS